MKCKHYMLVVLTILVITNLSACATIVTGTTQQITFDSEPKGLTVSAYISHHKEDGYEDPSASENNFSSEDDNAAAKDKSKTEEVVTNEQSIKNEKTIRVLGVTPFTIQLKKESNQVLVFEKEGYKTLEKQLNTTVSPMFFGNIIIGGLIGSTTDSISGAINQYDPDKYYITLEPLVGLKNNKHAIKDFIVLNYDNIVRDISRQEGAYLTSLQNIFRLDSDENKKLLKDFQSSSDKDNLPKFADEIISKYLIHV